MTRYFLLSIPLLACSASAALAADNVGTCGWGSKLMENRRGIAPQVLAVTTNGSSGSQTFGISSGTSGCTQDGIVKSTWKTAMFIDANRNKLALDTSRGSGESLQTLASLIGIAEEDKPFFYSVSRNNFASIFNGADQTASEIAAGFKSALAADSRLAHYAALI